MFSHLHRRLNVLSPSRGSLHYDIKTKSPIHIRNDIDQHIKSGGDVSETLVQEMYNNNEYNGIIDNYYEVYESLDGIDLDEILNTSYNDKKHIEGELLDGEGNILHGIATSELIYVTEEWAYTKSGSLYKLIHKIQ